MTNIEKEIQDLKMQLISINKDIKELQENKINKTMFNLMKTIVFGIPGLLMLDFLKGLIEAWKQ